MNSAGVGGMPSASSPAPITRKLSSKKSNAITSSAAVNLALIT